MDLMGYEFKKTKESWEKLIECVRKRLEEIGNSKEPSMSYYETTKGFYNLGEEKIKEKICEGLGIDSSEAIFEVKTHDNLEFGCQLFIFYNQESTF